MKVFTKESAAFITVAFFIWTIIEIVYDLITGVTIAEMMSAKYVVGYNSRTIQKQHYENELNNFPYLTDNVRLLP